MSEPMTPTTLAADAAQALQGVTEGPWVAYGEPEVGMGPALFAGVPGTEGFNLVEPLYGADLAFVAFARAWVPEAAAALTALSELNANLAAQVAELTADRDKWFEGAGAHHVASMKQAQRADIAEAKVARLDEILSTIVSRCDTAKQQCAEGAPVSAFNLASAILGQIGGYRAALTEGTPE